MKKMILLVLTLALSMMLSQAAMAVETGSGEFTVTLSQAVETPEGMRLTLAFENATGGEVSFGWVRSCELVVETDSGSCSLFPDEFDRIQPGSSEKSFMVSGCSGQLQSITITDLRLLDDRGLPETTVENLLVDGVADVTVTAESPETAETPASDADRFQ